MQQPFAQAREHARALATAGDLAGARTTLEEAVEAGRAGLAEGNPELLETMRQLAAVHTRTGDPTSARRVLEEAYVSGLRLGDANPLTLLISYDLGDAAKELGNRHAARTSYRRVAEFGPQVLGADHPAVAGAKRYMGEENQADQPADHHPTALLPQVPTSGSPVFGAPPSAPTPLSGGGMPPSGAPAGGMPPSGAAGYGEPTSGAPGHGMPASGMAGHGVPASVAPGHGMPTSGAPGYAVPTSGAPGHGMPTSGAPGFGGPASGPPYPVSGVPVPVASAPPFGAADPATPPARKTRVWVFVAAGVVVAAVAAVVIFALPERDEQVETVGAASPAPSTAVPSVAAESPAPSGVVGIGGALAVPSLSLAPEPSSAPTSEAAPTTTAPKTTAPKTSTRILNPKDGGTAPWENQVTFSLSQSDADSDKVLALSVCVGICYLEGEVEISGGKAQSRKVRLGSGEDEGVGQKWTLRLDRLSRSDYEALMAAKDDAINAGNWGSTGTPMESLNSTPVSTVTVTKQG